MLDNYDEKDLRSLFLGGLTFEQACEQMDFTAEEIAEAKILWDKWQKA